jgi:hypothetical protein
MSLVSSAVYLNRIGTFLENTFKNVPGKRFLDENQIVDNRTSLPCRHPLVIIDAVLPHGDKVLKGFKLKVLADFKFLSVESPNGVPRIEIGFAASILLFHN